MSRQARQVVLATALCMAVFIPSTAEAQEKPKAEFHVWVDAFAGTEGLVLYPQYGWKIETGAGKFNGYGFLERAPKEPLFTNHLFIFTPGKQRVLSVRTETGGRVAEFEPVPDKIVPAAGFFQIGPQLNFHEAVPAMKKSGISLVATWLPQLAGIRSENYLVAGGFSIRRNQEWGIFVDGYRRFFSGADYSEWWLLIKPRKDSRLSFGMFVLHDGSQSPGERTQTGFGGRIAPF
jgi:hypothetical protein